MKVRVKPAAFLVQGFSALAITFLTGLIGFVFAWPSYTLENLTSNSTVLSWPMSSTEVSLLGSVTNIGALVATPFCGYAINTFGRKYTAMLFGLPFVLAWLIIAFTNYVPLVIASIGIAGFGCAGQAVSSVYISEIAQDSIRGALTSTTISAYFAGLLLSYIIGGQLSYYQVIYVHLALSVLYIVLLLLLKDSPVYLVQKGRDEEAAQSIAFYRRVDATSKEVEIEINRIKQQLGPQYDKPPKAVAAISGSDKKQPNSSLSHHNESSWRFLCKSKSSKRALRMTLILMASNIMMGALVLQVYAEPIFREAVPSMSSNLLSIFLAIDLMVACLVCATIVDSFGRKSLMIWTSVACGVATLLLASQLKFDFAPHWFTVLLIYVYCFFYNLGAATVPYILTAEVFLPEVIGLCNSIVMGCMWITNFVTLIIFNPLVDSYGLGVLFYGFSVVCFLTALYSQFYLPETKGLSAYDIQPLFLTKSRRKSRPEAEAAS